MTTDTLIIEVQPERPEDLRKKINAITGALECLKSVDDPGLLLMGVFRELDELRMELRDRLENLEGR